jgi:hypothetical protein
VGLPRPEVRTNTCPVFSSRQGAIGCGREPCELAGSNLSDSGLSALARRMSTQEVLALPSPAASNTLIINAAFARVLSVPFPRSPPNAAFASSRVSATPLFGPGAGARTRHNTQEEITHNDHQSHTHRRLGRDRGSTVIRGMPTPGGGICLPARCTSGHAAQPRLSQANLFGTARH